MLREGKEGKEGANNLQKKTHQRQINTWRNRDNTEGQQYLHPKKTYSFSLISEHRRTLTKIITKITKKYKNYSYKNSYDFSWQCKLIFCRYYTRLSMWRPCRRHRRFRHKVRDKRDLLCLRNGTFVTLQ